MRENKLLVNSDDSYAYYGLKDSIEWEHKISNSKEKPDAIDNLVKDCKKRNLFKANKNIFELYERDYKILKIFLKLFEIMFEKI